MSHNDDNLRQGFRDYQEAQEAVRVAAAKHSLSKYKLIETLVLSEMCHCLTINESALRRTMHKVVTL